MKPKQPVVGLQPRFCLLHHTMEANAGRSDHWDLMLEHNGALVTFELDRLPAGPGLFETKRLADHRLAYLEYEGHISGNRGQVIRLDRGRYHEVDLHESLRTDARFEYHLTGQRLTAVLCANQPVYMFPFAQVIHLRALTWEWHD